MTKDRLPDQPAARGESETERSRSEAEDADARHQAEGGAESYGGDPDAEPSVTDSEVDAGLNRDQAEG